jgi:hypothetical protein
MLIRLPIHYFLFQLERCNFRIADILYMYNKKDGKYSLSMFALDVTDHSVSY